MTHPVKPSSKKLQRAALPPAAPADYSDEVTEAQINALRKCAPQDESKMGAVVHELSW